MEKIRHIVRIGNTDIEGHKPIHLALTKVRGIGVMYSNLICATAGLDKRMKAGVLSSDQIERINDILQNPEKHKIPKWIMNRRKDYNDGVAKHHTGGDLQFSQEGDLRRMKKIKSYRGWRHILGLPVRGQRTKGNFRKNRGRVVGVKKRKGVKAGRV
ncbi:30S ribosomal protein S13 [Candidatus Woesearchaeota archaeon]|nr:30S ribosomal protein S13 [Candidatus Woesearchaeota archaeon]